MNLNEQLAGMVAPHSPLDAAMRQLMEAWSPYKGERGGTGWQNEAGRVAYVKDMPGSGGSKDLFGEPVKPGPGKPDEIKSLGGRQQNLFGKRGLPGQMSLFADAGVPDELVAKRQSPAPLATSAQKPAMKQLENGSVGKSGLPPSGSLGDITAAAKRRYGDKFAGIRLATYGGGSQIEVRRFKDGYHGRENVIAATYPVSDEDAAAWRADIDSGKQERSEPETSPGDLNDILSGRSANAAARANMRRKPSKSVADSPKISEPPANVETKTGDILLRIPGEEGTEAVVSKHEKGYAVALRDTDAGETVQAIKIFPTEERALEYAKTVKLPE